MSVSTVVVALNAQLRRRLDLRPGGAARRAARHRTCGRRHRRSGMAWLAPNEPGSRPGGRQRRRLVGLLLALALLGHDGLMAADAHAAAGAAGGSAGAHDAGEPVDPTPTENGCEAGVAAAPRLDPGGRLDAAPASPVAALPAVAGAAPPAPAAPPPPPAGVRRALLQVFLI